MPELSVAIITLNEERNIQRCISSVKAFADEIIVVDSLSSDRTVEIAESLGAKVITQEFLGHIQQKNFAISKTSFPLVFSIDADEEVSEDLCRSILEVKANPLAGAWIMNRLNNYCGKWIYHSGWYPDSKIRLFFKENAHWGGTNPHDRIITGKDCRIEKLKGNLLHYSYYTISEHLVQSNKFSLIAAKAMFVEGKKANFIHIILSPCIKFIRNYFFKLGFLDGYYGYIICRITAFETFLKYVRLKNLSRPDSNV